MTRWLLALFCLLAACTSAPAPRCIDFGGSPRVVTADCAPPGVERSASDPFLWVDEGGTAWAPVCGDDQPTMVRCDASGRVESAAIPRVAACTTEAAPPVCPENATPRCVPVVCP